MVAYGIVHPTIAWLAAAEGGGMYGLRGAAYVRATPRG